MNVFKVLESAGIGYKVIDHPPVFTVADVGKYFPDDYPVKNLLLKEEKGDLSVFVIMKGDERLDTKKLADFLGSKKLQFTKPEVLMAKLGVEPGSASLFSLLHEGSGDVRVVVDSRLLSQPEVGFHPSANTQTVKIRGADISVFLDKLNRDFILFQL